MRTPARSAPSRSRGTSSPQLRIPPGPVGRIVQHEVDPLAVEQRAQPIADAAADRRGPFTQYPLLDRLAVAGILIGARPACRRVPHLLDPPLEQLQVPPARAADSPRPRLGVDLVRPLLLP